MKSLSIAQTAGAVRKKKISPKEALQFYISRAKKLDPELNSFLSLNEAALEGGLPAAGPLAGVPLAIKDIFCVKGMRTAAGSRMLKDFIPPYSATAVRRLESAGAIVLGKSNTDEFAMGSTGENSFFGPAKNPWDKKRSPGGSSSGGAAAVAARLAPGALGTDTGGSVRLPASHCHLTGIKPSYGRVSRYGMIAYGSSLDQAGVLTRSVADGALLLDAVCGPDPLDSTTADLPAPHFYKNLSSQIKGAKIGILDWRGAEISPAAARAMEAAISALKARGAKITEKKWPFFEDGVSVYYLISSSEASGNLARYDGIRYGFRSSRPSKNLEEFYGLSRGEGFGREVKRRILMGTFCLSEGYYEDYFHKACQVRQKIKTAFEGLFKDCAALLSPVSASPAPRLGESADPLELYMNDQFTVFANLTGLPAMSLPAALSDEGLPMGVQLTGPAFGEREMLSAALAIEEELQICGKAPEGF